MEENSANMNQSSECTYFQTVEQLFRFFSTETYDLDHEKKITGGGGVIQFTKDNKYVVKIAKQKGVNYPYFSRIDIYREILALISIHHPFVSQLKSWNIGSMTLKNYIGGSCQDLFTYINSFKKKGKKIRFDREPYSKILPPEIPPQKVYIICYGSAYLLRYLHSIQYCHRDFTPKNIFLDENFYPIIGDLGGAKGFGKDDQYQDNQLLSSRTITSKAKGADGRKVLYSQNFTSDPYKIDIYYLTQFLLQMMICFEDIVEDEDYSKFEQDQETILHEICTEDVQLTMDEVMNLFDKKGLLSCFRYPSNCSDDSIFMEYYNLLQKTDISELIFSPPPLTKSKISDVFQSILNSKRSDIFPLLTVLEERKNDPSALQFIGYCYAIGIGFLRNGRRAAKLFYRARCLGANVDQYMKLSNLSPGMIADGEGDYLNALKLYEKEAETSEESAIYHAILTVKIFQYKKRSENNDYETFELMEKLQKLIQINLIESSELPTSDSILDFYDQIRDKLALTINQPKALAAIVLGNLYMNNVRNKKRPINPINILKVFYFAFELGYEKACRNIVNLYAKHRDLSNDTENRVKRLMKEIGIKYYCDRNLKGKKCKGHLLDN